MDVLITKTQSVLTLQFNRPAKKNAITAAMYQSMADALKNAEDDSSIRVILFIGGPQIYTAGNDLEDFAHQPPSTADSPVHQFLRQISRANKPIIAAVAGAAVGIGTTMLLHCDLVYAAPDARFSMPFVQLGLCPEAASSLLLPQLMGYQRAAEKLLFGEAFQADEAHRCGLVTAIVDADKLHSFAHSQAVKLAGLPAASVRTTKRLMKSSQVASIESSMAAENDLFGAMLSSPEAREAFGAFFEKRKADFSRFS